MNTNTNSNFSENVRVNKIRRFLNRKEFLEIQYTQLYKEVKIYFNEELMFETSGLEELSKGVNFLLPDGRQINIQYNTEPIEFTVKINGIYAQNSFHHPKQKVKSLVTWYSVILVFSILGFFLTSISFSPELIFFSLLIIAFDVLIISGLSIGNKYFVYIGFFVFILRTVFMLGVSAGKEIAIIIMPIVIFRIIIIILTIKKLKVMEEFHNYRLFAEGNKF